jgi:hypothetical protein
MESKQMSGAETHPDYQKNTGQLSTNYLADLIQRTAASG